MRRKMADTSSEKGIGIQREVTSSAIAISRFGRRSSQVGFMK
jgi:hypothetical protein